MSRFNCNVHHITIKPETDSLIIEFADVFKGLEKVEGKYINLHQITKSVIHPPRKVPLTRLPKLKETLNKLIKANFISKIEEPTDWVSSLVMGEKKDKTLRICLDPKELNQHIL